jgi:hypothetical protein
MGVCCAKSSFASIGSGRLFFPVPRIPLELVALASVIVSLVFTGPRRATFARAASAFGLSI